MSYGNGAPPTYMRPENISQRPNPDGVIFVETASTTAMPPPPMTTSVGTSSQSQSQSHTDLAGVLRRNQACLNCRRRKLKCDAVRPHCGTCVRSYKHALRTSPKSNPTMACEYDEESGTASGPGPSTDGISASAGAVEDEDGSGSQEGDRKRKRKSTTARKKSEDDDASRASLVKRIQELEAQIQARNGNGNGTGQSQTGYPHTSAPSPTALLDLLSSTASAQASAQPAGGLKSGAADNVMYTGSTGLTPMFVVDDPMNATSAVRPPVPELQHSTSTATESTTSRRTSDIVSNPPSSGPSILSPYHLLNLSPAPSTEQPPDKDKMSNPWLGPGLQPSTRVDGPWKGVETTETIFAGTGAKIDGNGVPMEQIPVYPQVSTDGFVNDPTNILGTDGYMMDDAAQQRLLMDLFWPGWPPNLPEPNIVNDLYV